MVQTIYADALFLVNFIINYLLLCATATLAGGHKRQRRIISSAAAGGVYSVLVFFRGFEFLSSALIKTAVAALMVAIAFGFKARAQPVRRFFVFWGLSFGFAGCVTALCFFTDGMSGLVRSENMVFYIKIPLATLALATALAYALFSLIFKSSASGAGKAIVKINVSHNGINTSLNALHDTGMNLSAPITGAPVIVAEYSEVRNLLSSVTRRLLDKRKPSDFPLALAHIPREERFRLIPYRTIAQDFSLLLAFRPEHINMDGQNADGALLALCPEKISSGGAYTALI